MRAAILALGLAVLAPLPALGADCKLVQSAALPLSRTPDGWVVVPVEVGGTHARFTLNTGSVVSFVTPQAAALTAFHTEAIENVYASGNPLHQAAILSMFTLGGLVGTNQRFVLLSNGGSTTGGTDGEIGLDKLEGYDVELDLGHDKMNLFRQDHCPGQAVYWTDSAAVIPFQIQPDGQINLPMELDGKPVNVILDTTQSTSEIGVAAVHRLFGLARNELTAVPADGGPGDYRGAFHTLSVGGLAISNPDIAIFDYGDSEAICDGKFHVPPRSRHYPVPYRCYGGGDMRIGLKQLRALRMFISFSEKTLYVTPAGAH